MKKLIIALLFVTLIILGYGSTRKSDITLSEEFLESKGYRILSYTGFNESYPLTVNGIIYSGKWELQNVDPTQYIGKNITYLLFRVKNHPLDKWVEKDNLGNVTYRANGKVGVMLFLVNGKVIGGVSGLLGYERIGSPIWSLDGKSFEEVHPEALKIGIEKWYANWHKRFQK